MTAGRVRGRTVPPSRYGRRFDGHRPAFQQLRWSSTAPAIASIESGEEIVVRVPDSSTGQLGPRSTREDLLRMDFEKVDAAVGPFDVPGARPGDSVRVEILDLRPGTWGWSGIFRTFGLLQGRFDDDLVVWSIGRSAARPRYGFLRDLAIPLQPMLGWIGLAPPEGELGMIPPQTFGGNLDNRLHGAGTVLELPVQRPGAGLMLGDPHAAQGDGEVCGTGIETEAEVRLRITLMKDRRIRGPRAVTTRTEPPGGPWLVTEGVGPDPTAAARAATEEMIASLEEYGATPAEAYLLASVAGHLRWSEIVDAPNVVISMLFPRRLAEGLGPIPPARAVKLPGRTRRLRGRR